MSDKLTSAWWALGAGLGLGALLAGLGEFFDVLADWGPYLRRSYLNPSAGLLPISADTFMRLVGLIEMAVGFLILAGFARVGGYILMVWLATIAVSLVSTGRFLDVAVRDVAMAIAAFTLARLTEV